jgi:hypothetical protein
MSDWPELSKLAEAIALGDGFAFYVLIAPSPEAAAEALSALQKEIEQGAGAAYAVESIRPLLAAEAPKAETEAALMALLSPRADARYVVLDLSDTRDFSEGPLGHLFFRLNEQRNRLVAQVNRPLILVIPPFAERLLQDTAQDLWSIRGLPAVLLPVDTLRRRMPGLASASEPARHAHPPVSILIIAPMTEKEYVNYIGDRMLSLVGTGVLRMVWLSPHSWLRANDSVDSIHDADVLLLVGANETDWPRRVPFLADAVRFMLSPQKQIVLFGSREHWQSILPRVGRADRGSAVTLVRVDERVPINPMLYIGQVEQAIVDAVNRCRVQRGQQPLLWP